MPDVKIQHVGAGFAILIFLLAMPLDLLILRRGHSAVVWILSLGAYRRSTHRCWLLDIIAVKDVSRSAPQKRFATERSLESTSHPGRRCLDRLRQALTSSIA